MTKRKRKIPKWPAHITRRMADKRFKVTLNKAAIDPVTKEHKPLNTPLTPLELAQKQVEVLTAEISRLQAVNDKHKLVEEAKEAYRAAAELEQARRIAAEQILARMGDVNQKANRLREVLDHNYRDGQQSYEPKDSWGDDL